MASNQFSVTPHGPITRSEDDRMVAGVAGGIADYLDVDPTVVRLGFVALTLFGGIGVPLYGAAWLLMRDEDGGESIASSFCRGDERVRGGRR